MMLFDKKHLARLSLNFFAMGIVVISSTVASAETAECTWAKAKEAELSNFIPKEPPKAISEENFFNLDGTPINITAFKGSAVVMNFWATWCAPCVAEMPSLDRLSATLKGSGIQVLAISEDRKAKTVAPKFYEANNIKNLDVYFDQSMAFSRATKVTGLPTTLLINENGEEVGAVLGEAEWDAPSVVSFLKACLNPSQGG